MASLRSCLAAALLAALGLTLARSACAQQRVLGLDVSAWQGSITAANWNTLRTTNNRAFAFIRSSRGGTTGYYNQSNAGNDNPPGQNTLSQRYDDPYFVQNITRATAAGLFAGAYHFARPDIIASTLNSGGIANTGADEADHFIQMAGPWMRPGYLLPTLDLEAGQAQRTSAQLTQFAIDFSDEIYAQMGIRPMVYSGGNYTGYVQPSIVAALPNLWIARWPNNSNPNAINVQTANPNDSLSNLYGPWDDSGNPQPWKFWQYASTMSLSGYPSGNLDVNVANGGMEFLKDQLVPALWVSNDSGEWTDTPKWNSGITPVAPVQGQGQVNRVGTMVLPPVRLPGVNDTVILDRTGADVTLTLSSGTQTIRKLYAREALNITGGSLTINYTPSADSTPISAQFSAPVSLGGTGALSVHTLQVDAQKAFTLSGGSLTFNKINLMPHALTPAKIMVTGAVALAPLGSATATIANGSGSGSTGRIDFAAGQRRLDVADGPAAIDAAISVPIINGGLIKAGPGTLSLTGANIYGGDTAVEEGTLRLGGGFLADGADLFLTTGSLLDLAFSGAADVIDSLFIDGVSQPAGVWGAVGSGAQFTSPLLAGTGTLQVSTFIAPPIPGDFNGDGTVDGSDLLMLNDGFGIEEGATMNLGDANGDGAVDGADLLVWQQNATGGEGASAAAQATPEPAGAWMAAAMLAVLLWFGGRELRELRAGR